MCPTRNGTSLFILPTGRKYHPQGRLCPVRCGEDAQHWRTYGDNKRIQDQLCKQRWERLYQLRKWWKLVEKAGNWIGERNPQQKGGVGKDKEKPKPNLVPNRAWWLPWCSRVEREAEASRNKINFIQLLTGGNQYKTQDWNKYPDLMRKFIKFQIQNWMG